MNGCSSPGGPAAPSLEGEASVTRALETVFQLQGPTVRRPPKRVQAEGLEAYPLPAETLAEPDWKRRQAERIRAWRLKASLEPSLETKEHRSGSRFQWQSEEYQAKARQRTQAAPASKSELEASTHEGDTDRGPAQKIPGNTGQHITEQPDVSATAGLGQAKPAVGRGLALRANHVRASAGDEPALHGLPERTRAASGRKPGGRLDSRNAKTADDSGDDEEEACMAPCSDDEKETLTPMREQRPDDPDKVRSEKEKSRANKPALAQGIKRAKISASQSQSINRTESRPEPGLSCSAKRQQKDTVSISLDKDSTSAMTKGELPGGSPSCPQEEAKALESNKGDKPETVTEQNAKPAADKSWALCQAAKIRAWRDAQNRAQSGINVGSSLENQMTRSIPVHAATGFGAWSQVTHKRVHAPVEVGGEHALLQSRDQAKLAALVPGIMHALPESKQTPEAQLGVLQNTEHGEYMELASNRGHQVGEVSMTPVGEHTGSSAGNKPVLDKSWALCQAAKIKAWCEASARSGGNTLSSSLYVESTFDPKQRVIETTPVPHKKRKSKQSAHNVEAMHTSNQQMVENTLEEQVYKLLSAIDAHRRVEQTVAPSNLNLEDVYNSKQWTVDGMHVCQGPEVMIAPKAPERQELTVKPSGSNIKWWDVESSSSRQSKGTGAEWETSSSGKSYLLTRDHNVKSEQAMVDSTSVHPNPSFQPLWKAASEGEPYLERNHLSLESMHNPKLGDVENMPLCPTSGIGSWLEDISRRKTGLLNIETAHRSKWVADESMPVRYTTGLTSCNETASMLKSAVTWEHAMTSSSYVVDTAAQSLPNDFSAWWRRAGDRADPEETRRKKAFLFGGRRVSLNTESHSSFIASEKKRMQEWAQSFWNQATSK